MKQILTIAFQASLSQRIRRCLEKHADRYALCGTAENSVTGMSLIEATCPDIVIMPAKMLFWNAENLINHLISRGFCPCFLLFCDGPLVIGEAAKVKVAEVLPETSWTEEQLLEALHRAEERTNEGGLSSREVRPANSAVQHSLEVMELLMGLAPLQTQEAQQKYGRLRVGRRSCWLILGAAAPPFSGDCDYLSDLTGLEELIQSLTILLRPLGACEICVYRETNLCILLEEQPGSVPDWNLWLGRINLHLETIRMRPLCFELSDEPLPLERWQSGCRELLRLRESRFFLSPLYLQPKTREARKQFVSYEQIHSHLSSLSQALQSCNSPSIRCALAELEEMVCSSMSRDVYSFVSSQMVLQYSNLCYSLQPDPQAQLELSFQFRQFVSVADFFAAYRQKIALLLERLSQGSASSAVVAKVCQYIQQHLSEDLSLELLAGQAYLSPSYFSRLFKKEMYVPLSTYINQLRVQKAQQLLRTSCGVTELAALVGFDNPKYFSQVFKKYTGKTPQDYRKSLQEGEQP